MPSHRHPTPTINFGWILLQLLITLILLLLSAAVMAAIIISIFFLCNKYGGDNKECKGKEVREVKESNRRRGMGDREEEKGDGRDRGKRRRLWKVENHLEKCLGRELEVMEGRTWGLEKIWARGGEGVGSSVESDGSYAGSGGSRGVEI